MNELERRWRQLIGAGISCSPPGGFEVSRFAEGGRVRGYLETRYPAERSSGCRLLDVGCGDAGVSLPFAGDARYESVAVDTTPRSSIAALAREFDIPMTHVVASVESLPFASEAFDIVLYVETAEHVAKPVAAGEEIVRVLRPGGICYITTPARLRYLLGPDPHYRIHALLLLPDRLQKIAFRLLRPSLPYEVTHVYWTVRGIMRTLPGLELCEVTSRHAWARGPLRNIDWDWIIARKPNRSS